VNTFQDTIASPRGLDDAARLAWISRHAPRFVEKFESTREAYDQAGLAATPAELDRLVLENFRYVWSYYARFGQLLLHARRKELQCGFEVDGLPALRRSLSRGRGAILVTSHLGDFDLAGSWLAQQAGLPVVTVVDTVTPRVRQLFFDSCRRRAGIKLRYESETRLEELADDLRRGSLLVLMADRRVRGPAVQVRFFGHPASISMVPHLLAQRCSAPIFAGATTWIPGNRTVGHLVEVFDPTRDDAQANTTMAVVIRHFERLIRGAPAQWHIPADLGELPWRSPVR
jgi:KDO2-lipid IV(A) lauroyltransferase